MHVDNPIVISLCEKAAASGGRALIVGGWVRDQVLGFESKDVDIDVYGVAMDTLKGILSELGEFDAVGESFGIFKLRGHDIDVSLPRREIRTGSGHRGFEVSVDAGLTVKEASRRRDFTMNSMSFDPLSSELLDPFGGKADLAQRILQVTDASTFVDDPLRILRAAQFLARFDLAPSDELIAISRTLAPRLVEIAAERHFMEWEKLLLRGTKPSKGLRFMHMIGVLPAELQALVRLPQDPEWHPEGDVWTHTLLVVDEMAKTEGKTLARMFGALLHDVGKATTTTHEDGHIRSLAHAEEGAPIAASFLAAMKAPSLLISQVELLVSNHMAPIQLRDSTSKAFHRLARRLAVAKLCLLDVEAVARADHFGRTTADALARQHPAGDLFLDTAKRLHLEKESEPDIVLGRHLIAKGISPGPRIGELLRICRDIQDEGVRTVEEILAKVELNDCYRQALEPHGSMDNLHAQRYYG